MTRLAPLCCTLALLTGCARQPSVKSGVDLEQIVKGKSRVPPDSHEAIPNTFFELTAWTLDATQNPPTASSGIGSVGSASQVACASATEKIGAENTGRCEITVAGTKYTLKARDAVLITSGGEVTLACIGEGPAHCRAVGVN